MTKEYFMKQKKTWILLVLLFFGAFCFGCGVLYGQFMLTQKGFVYEENALAESDEVRSVSVSDQVNINTASVEELMSVSGIGEVTAEKIIASREEEGAFDDVHDLVARGILGEGKLEQISAYLRVD